MLLQDNDFDFIGSSEYKGLSSIRNEVLSLLRKKYKGGGMMASENKKRKARNSYLYSGADKLDCKMKRTMYYTKRQRKKLKEMESK